MTEVAFAHPDDHIVDDLSLEDQARIAEELGLDSPDLFIEGVLNDILVYVLPEGFALDGESYQYLVLGHRFATANSNTLYAQYTRHEDVYENWERIQSEQSES